MTPLDLGAISPMLALALGTALLPLGEVLLTRKNTILGTQLTRERRGTYLAFGASLALLAAFILTLAAGGSGRAFNPGNPLIAIDGVTGFLNSAVLLAALLSVLASSKYLADIRSNVGGYYALLLASVTGMVFATAATHLVLLFAALELASIPAYALVGLRRGSRSSGEAALKYFATGAFASGCLLYGGALLYGATGELDLRAIGASFDPEDPTALMGAGLVLIGLAFRVTAVPFHQWAPDTYEGAPTTVSALLSTALTIASFGALIRVLALALQPAADILYGALWVLAAASMTLGNLMALTQRNLKRMLAYASIAHAGYALIGVLVGGVDGLAAVLFYLLVYAFMTLGAFVVVAVLARDGREHDRLEDLAGLVQTRPFVCVAMTICVLSLLGVPGTAGFLGKFQLLSAAVSRGLATGDGWLIGLAVLGALNVVVSAAYYLRIPMAMFMRPAPADAEARPAGSFDQFVLLTCSLACIALGIAPQDAFVLLPGVDVLRLAQIAASALH